jgi:MFS family permease
MSATAAISRRGAFAAPGALVLVSISIVARLPVPMRSLLLLVHAQQLTGSFAVAGVVTAAYTVGRGAGGPLLGQLVDRRGQSAVLVGSAIASALLMVSIALLPAGAPVALLVAVAAAMGLVTPPLNGCARALLPELVDDAEALPAAYAFESSALELTFIFGPPLALGLAAISSTGAALAISGIILLAGTVAFAAMPASRLWQPASQRPRQRGGALRSPAICTLVLALLAVGAVFGAAEVGVTAAAKALGSTSTAGPLLALWGVGSLIGGVVATRLGGGARSAGGLALILGTLALGHAALAVTAGSLLAMGAVLVLAGAAISPAYATIYAFVDRVTPSGTVTEAFSWLATAVCVGTSAGTAIAGSLAQHSGPASAFAFAGGAGALAVLITVLRARTLSLDTRVGDRPASEAVAAV